MRCRHLLPLAAVLAATPAGAQQIATRTDLLSILGGFAVTESFEGFSVPPTWQIGLYGPINSGNAPVVNGVEFENVEDTNNPFELYVSSAGYFGHPSQGMLSGSATLGIRFIGTTTAFGLDLRADEDLPETTQVDVYRDATLLFSSVFSVPGPTGGPFVGFQDAAGITHVNVTSHTFNYSTTVDDVTFAATTAVPEPATVVLTGVGLLALAGVARRRRVA